MARLKKTKDASKFEFLNFDDTKTFFDYAPNSCSFCKLVFFREYSALNHKIDKVCTECQKPMICRQGTKEHDLVSSCGSSLVTCYSSSNIAYWNSVCHYQYPKCRPGKYELHARTHPRCDCGCNKRYISAEAMRVHLESLRVYHCDSCTERFLTCEDLIAHAAAQNHSMKCNIVGCSARNIKNMPKHHKKCHKPKAEL